MRKAAKRSTNSISNTSLKSIRLRNSICFLAVLLFVVTNIFAQTVTNAISKDKLVALKTAGVSDSVLIQQIQKDGISFDMNSDTTLELKNAGFSNEILQALLQASSKVPAGPTHATQNDSVATLYKAGRFPELADRLRALLKTDPSDYRTQTLLIMTLLKMKEKDAAKSEYEQLAAHDQDPVAAPFVKQVMGLLDSLERTEKAKAQLIDALKDYRVADATAIIDQLSASPVQKEILKINLDVYEAKFDQARDRFSKIQFASYSEKERSVKIGDNITKTEAAYKKLKSRIDWYLYPPLAPVKCVFPLSANLIPDHELTSQTVREYVELVNNLTQLTPLSDEVRSLSFHAQLLGGQYDQLELLGDQLLKTNGRIRVPFYASDRFFQLVIDSQRKHVYTEADPHPYEPRLSYGWWADLVPFDLAFAQIKSISQKAYHAPGYGPVIQKKSYALKFELSGVAPNYGLMNILYCTVGEKAELTVTRNLGQYILHVLGGTDVTADLADPSKAKGPSSGWLTGLLVAGASMSSNPGLKDAAVQGLQADQAQQIANYQAQQAAWGSFTTQDTFNFLEADAFTGLEQLLGVLN
jgi:hypothetical protein